MKKCSKKRFREDSIRTRSIKSARRVHHSINHCLSVSKDALAAPTKIYGKATPATTNYDRSPTIHTSMSDSPRLKCSYKSSGRPSLNVYLQTTYPAKIVSPISPNPPKIRAK